MKVSIENIRFFNQKYGCAGDPMPNGIDELVEKINTQLGGVDEVIDLGKKYEGILIAKIVSCVKHPNADKLSVCLIDDGGVNKDVGRDSNGYVQVVCGAPNAREGLVTAWIPPNVVVPSTFGKDPLQLESREIRGELSNGMLASASELAISGDHTGIVEVGENSQPGSTFADKYKLNDYIIDIENKMFTHRPDLFGMMGVAREIAGIQGQQHKSPDWYLTPISVEKTDDLALKVDNKIQDKAPRFMATAISGVKVEPSPLWLQINLMRVGMKPINNIVDLTNYFMYLTGQPLHAYDYDKVKSLSSGTASLVVRQGNDKEKLKLLGGKEIELSKNDIVIATDKVAIGLGGIMGGQDTEVDENTKHIILECANFDMYTIRRSSMTHGLFTDASTRFTKGQSPLQCPAVIAKTIDDIKRIAGGQVASELVDIHGDLKSPKVVQVSAEFINNILGSNMNADQIAGLLKNTEFDLGGEAKEVTSEYFGLYSPFWRTDIEIPEDIAEEVGRLYGFNKLPKALPERVINPSVNNPQIDLKKELRGILASLGANEVLTYNFVHGNLLEKAGQKPQNSYKLRNALSPDLQYYRQTLTPNLLDKVHPNVKAGYDKFAIFEIGKSHNKIHSSTGGIPDELDMIALVFVDKNPGKNDGSAYYSARKYLDELMNKLGIELEYKPADEKMDYPVTAPFDLKRSALVTDKETNTFIGIIGEYKNSVNKNFKLPKAVAGFELGTTHILEALEKMTQPEYTPLAKYPSTEQDVTVEVSDSANYSDVELKINEVLKKSDYRYQVSPVSIYQPEGQDVKKITFRVVLSHKDRTLTTDEVNNLMALLA